MKHQIDIKSSKRKSEYFREGHLGIQFPIKHDGEFGIIRRMLTKIAP